jgi:hypothetical protein
MGDKFSNFVHDHGEGADEFVNDLVKLLRGLQAEVDQLRKELEEVKAERS